MKNKISTNKPFSLLTKWVMALALPFLVFQAGQAQTNYVKTDCNDAYVQAFGLPGTTFLGNGDDVIFNLNVPFAFFLYGQPVAAFQVGTNGFMVAAGGTNRGLGNATLPTAIAGACLAPFWDDLDAGPTIPNTGIYYRTDGVAPNRVFTIEWYQVGHFGDVAGQFVTFQVKLLEGSNIIRFVYQDVFFGGTQTAFDRGLSATVGIEGPLPAPRPFNLHSFNQAVLNNGQCIQFAPPPPCSLVCPANISVSNTPGLCGANVNFAVTFGTDCGVVNISHQPGFYAPGVTTVTANSPSTFTSCSFTITVTDTEPPTFDPCPADFFINLDPGLCETVLNYNLNATDNCPTIQSSFTQSLNNTLINNSLACAAAPASYIRRFNLPAIGINQDVTLPQIRFGIWAGAFNANVRIFRMIDPNGPFVYANFQLLQASVHAVPAGANFMFTCDIPDVVVPAGSTLVIDVRPNLPSFRLGLNSSGETAPTYFSSDICTLAGMSTVNPISFAAGGFGTLHWPLEVFYLAESVTLMQIDNSGYTSGDAFPIGTTIQEWKATDGGGNMSFCEFSVTVLEYPNPNQTLACNDNVQISVDEDGCSEVGADAILEGGPYGCYDDYIVEVLNQFGFPIGNTVCCDMVGQVRTVRVTDPDTGNKCWGSIMIKDKLPPVIECNDINISCTETNIPNEPAPALAGGEFLQVLTGLNNPLGEAGAPVPDVQDYTFNLNYLPAGHPVLDVDVRIRLIDHDALPNIDISVISPDGQLIRVFGVTGCTLQNWPIDVWFDDEGSGGLTACAALNVNGAHLQCLLLPGVQNPNVLNGFDGDNASGTWTVRITDANNVNDGLVTDVGLKVTTPEGAMQVIPTDNCSVETLTFTESVNPGDCNGPSEIITRVWTATDPSGNSSSCTQTITRTRPSLSDVELPADYDGIDEDILDCSGSPWDTNGNGYPDPDETGWPTIGGLPFQNGDVCNFTWTYNDILIPICEGSFKIRRDWLIIDWCTGDDLEHQQFIKVLDQTGPTVVCPTSPLTINVYSGSYNPNGGPHQICKGNVVIPPLVVTGDDCSGVNPGGYVTELWTFGAGTLLQSIPGNGGTFPNVELIADNPPSNNAQYTVRHVFKDICGNISECIYNITVLDKVPPVPICDEITELALTNNGGSGEGCSWLTASDLDDGSYDNCGDVYFYAAKMNAFLTPPYFYQYYPQLEFCCSEVGDNMVIVLVLDFDPATIPGALLPDGSVFLFPGNPIYEGSFNTCMVTVQVTDKIPPVTLFCPQGQTITCDTYLQNYAAGVANGDYSVLDGFGSPTFYDNCEYDLNHTVTVNLNNCTEGTITRSWTASDSNGQATCTQTITVTHVSNWVVEFPADFTGECVDGQLPDTGEPEIFHDECELIGVSHEDQLFTVVPDACYKIVRTWTVINWCIYDDFGYDAYSEAGKAECNLNVDWDGDGDKDCRTFRDGWNSTGSPGTPDGYIVWKQTIKVNDNEDPDFTIPAIDGCIVDTDCDTDITLPYPVITDECSLSFDVDITGDLGNFLNITGDVTVADVEVGEYEITYAVTDNCGNTSYQTITVVVEDCKLPTPYCVNGLVIEIMQTGMIEIWAEDFDAGSFDNCGPVQLSLSPDVTDINAIFTCDELGQNPIQLWVTDIYGNQDYCETFVVVQDNLFSCNSVTIAGAIATEEEEGVEGVDVQVNGGLFSELTDLTGNFSFDALAAGGDYTVTPMLDVEASNGVTTWDLVLISRHILGIQLLDSPYKIIAADANKTNNVTTLDMVAIRKVILQIEPGFPNNTSWRFVDKDYAFPNPANPFVAQFPEVINYNNLASNQLLADFVAIKVGDVNGSAATNATDGAQDRTFNGSMNMDVQDRELVAGKSYTVAFAADAIDLLGYQFTLSYNTQAVEVVEVVAGVATEEHFGMLLEEGVITTSWNVSEARALAQGEVLFSLVIKATADVTLSEVFGVSSAYTVAEAYNANSELLDVKLTFNGMEANSFALYQNVPNPFKGATVVGFTLPASSTAKLTVMDISGKVLQVVEGDYSKGYNEVRLSNIPATGVLYYQLDTPTHSATRKMVILN
ncbi:MAG: T9SS type A sorting domain-containing protein [Saprospirales bacterium]|nr:T9SS type A sorting domain-containing protein [Saprospirales bacterium]